MDPMSKAPRWPALLGDVTFTVTPYSCEAPGTGWAPSPQREPRLLPPAALHYPPVQCLLSPCPVLLSRVLFTLDAGPLIFRALPEALGLLMCIYFPWVWRTTGLLAPNSCFFASLPGLARLPQGHLEKNFLTPCFSF